MACAAGARYKEGLRGRRGPGPSKPPPRLRGRQPGAAWRPVSRLPKPMGHGFDGLERALQQLDRLAQRNVAVGILRKVLSELLDEQLGGLDGLLVAQNDIGHRSASFAGCGP